jgi:hypothetical protein
LSETGWHKAEEAFNKRNAERKKKRCFVYRDNIMQQLRAKATF